MAFKHQAEIERSLASRIDSIQKAIARRVNLVKSWRKKSSVAATTNFECFKKSSLMTLR